MNGLSFCALALLTAITLHADLSTAKAEPNLEKRSRLALENADAALRTAQEDYEKGDPGSAETFISEMEQSVEVAHGALAATGKNPLRSPKHFKYAELKSRDLLRRLEGFERSMDFADRKFVEHAKMKIQEIHDEWLLGIMGNKK